MSRFVFFHHDVVDVRRVIGSNRQVSEDDRHDLVCNSSAITRTHSHASADEESYEKGDVTDFQMSSPPYAQPDRGAQNCGCRPDAQGLEYPERCRTRATTRDLRMALGANDLLSRGIISISDGLIAGSTSWLAI